MSTDITAIVFFGALLEDYTPPENHILPESDRVEVFFLRSCRLPFESNEREYPVYAVALKKSLMGMAVEHPQVLTIDSVQIDVATRTNFEVEDFAKEHGLQLEDEVRWIFTTRVL